MLQIEKNKSFFEKARTIYITGVIEAGLVEEVIKGINYFMELDNKKPIHLQIASPGGSVPDGLALIDYIRNVKTPIHTRAIGGVASMGSLIFISGHKRVMTEMSTLMLHDMSVGTDRRQYHQMKSMNDYHELLENNIIKVIKKYTELSDELIKEVMTNERWFTSKECIQYKMCDTILGESNNETV